MSERILPPPLMFGQDWSRMGLGMSAFMGGFGEQQPVMYPPWMYQAHEPQRHDLEKPASWAHERYGHDRAEEIRKSGSPWLGIAVEEVMGWAQKALDKIDAGKRVPDTVPEAPSFTMRDLERHNAEVGWVMPPAQKDKAPDSAPSPSWEPNREERPFEWPQDDIPKAQPPTVSSLSMPSDNREMTEVLRGLKDVLKELSEVLREKKSQKPGIQSDGSFVPMGQGGGEIQPERQRDFGYRPATPSVPHTSQGVPLPNVTAIMRTLIRGV